MTAHHPSLAAAPERRFRINVWDFLVFALVIGALALVAFGGRQTVQPLDTVTRAPLSLDPVNLPNYALRTTLRMLAAMGLSLLFTFVYGAAAAKSRRGEMILIPLLDVLQSVPILGFLSFTVTGFMSLFPGNVLGVELAAIFVIFTSQAWNMAFSFYYSLKTVPKDLKDASDSLRLGAWWRFWILEAPYAAPGLIWNAMMSMSGAWFFVVASEAISVGRTTIALPGVGSYVQLAIDHGDMKAVGWAVLTMLIVILIYDQLLFRPLVAWSEKFRVDMSAVSQGPPPQSWFLDFIQRAQLAKRVWTPVGRVVHRLQRIRFAEFRMPPAVADVWASRKADYALASVMGLLALYAAFKVVAYVGTGVGWGELPRVVGLTGLTLIRVIVLLVVASLIWVPIGVWVGLRPKLAEVVQPLTQFAAAFPSNLLFPVFVLAIVATHANADIWLSPLMILGAQWYILFNVIAGASSFPADMREATASLGIKGWPWWRKVMLPAIFPSYVTGALTASGGAWNAAIVAEVASWRDTRLEAHGIGAYIADATAKGDFPRITLGVAVMALFVVLLNRYFWRPVFAYGSRKLGLA